YATALETLSYFTLDAAGNPTFVGCMGNQTGCTATNPANALIGAGAMAFSGSNLYVADSFQSNVSHLTLASDSTPTFAGCSGSRPGCTPGCALTGAEGAATVGQNLYASSSSNSIGGSSEVNHFTLDAAGTPTFDVWVGEKSGGTATSPAGALENAGDLL